jgi:cytoskeletal protein RodZ
MAFYTMIGLIVVAAILGAGVYWMMLNITFKRQPRRYTYKTDEAGNEYVQDNSKDEQNAPKT